MNSIDNILAGLLTGHNETDDRLRKAYELGLCRGRDLDRESSKRNAQIQTTRLLLNALMATQNIELQAAMNVLRIPKAERKTYVKLRAEKQNHKQAPRKRDT